MAGWHLGRCGLHVAIDHIVWFPRFGPGRKCTSHFVGGVPLRVRGLGMPHSRSLPTTALDPRTEQI